MNAATITIGATALVIATSGCGGAKTVSTASTQVAARHTPSAADQLTAAARDAVLAHHRLSVRALWLNEISKKPAVIAGPALADLRSAVAARRNRGIRIRLISERFRIISIRLDPSYATASAVISDPQHVRPYAYDGRPLGPPVTLNEHARIELHRLDRSRRFVVWTVTAIK